MPNRDCFYINHRFSEKKRGRASGFVLKALGFYKSSISGALPPSCRFVPTCSEYMAQAVETHGVLKGVGLGVLRLLRCNPFFKGGYDPVPPLKERKARRHT